jgi:transcriptional regulator GlxA family with amidase domain
MLGFPQAQVLDVTGPLEVFARTARWLVEHRGARHPPYVTEFVAARAGPVAMSNGLELVAGRRYADVRDADTLLVAGGIGWEMATKDRALLAWLKAQAGRVRRLGSICNGALLLAAAGLLDGKPATTHWAYLDRLAAMAPRARIDRDALYVRAGNLYTSAGVTAGLDLSLALIEQDHGKAVALAVAQELVLFLRRPGGQSQFSRHLEAQRRDDLFGELELWMLENPRAARGEPGRLCAQTAGLVRAPADRGGRDAPQAGRARERFRRRAVVAPHLPAPARHHARGVPRAVLEKGCVPFIRRSARRGNRSRKSWCNPRCPRRRSSRRGSRPSRRRGSR